VDQVEVEVVDAEVLERGVEAGLDVVAVERVPELRGDEELVAADARLADRLADGVLICGRVSAP
jgi:hypothetical protein